MIKRLAVVDPELCVGCQSCMFACTRRLGFGGLGKSCILARSIGGISQGFTIVVCRACPEPSCLKVCPVGALQLRDQGGVRLDASKCLGSECQACREACPYGAIFWDKSTNKPLICVYCGYCADYCPYHVIIAEGADNA